MKKNEKMKKKREKNAKMRRKEKKKEDTLCLCHSLWQGEFVIGCRS